LGKCPERCLKANKKRGAKRQEEGAANSSINRELSALKRAFSLARIAGDIVYQPHIQLLDESDNVRQGFVNPAEFVKLHDNLPGSYNR